MTNVSFIIDIDGTICPIKKPDERYEDLVPYAEVVDKIRSYKEEGARIVLFTSRNMKTYKGNIGLINKNTSRVLMDWLDKWDIPYDEILFGKPWPGECGFYVDDRAIRPNEFLNKTVKELSQLCAESRLVRRCGNEHNHHNGWSWIQI